MRNSFLIYGEYEKYFDMLPPEELKILMKALFTTFRGEDTNSLEQEMEGATKMAFAFMQNQLLVDTKKYQEKCEVNRANASNRKRTQANASENEQTQVNASDGKQSQQDKDIDKDIDLDKDIKLVKNIFFDYKELNKNACARVRERTAAERKEFLTNFKEFFAYHQTERFAEVGYEILDTLIEAYEQAQTSSGLTFKQKKYNAKTFYPVFEISEKSFESIVTQLAFNSEIENRPAYILGAAISAMEVIT